MVGVVVEVVVKVVVVKVVVEMLGLEVMVVVVVMEMKVVVEMLGLKVMPCVSVCLSAQTSTSWTSPPTTWTWRPSRRWLKHSTSSRWLLGFLFFCRFSFVASSPAADRCNLALCRLPVAGRGGPGVPRRAADPAGLQGAVGVRSRAGATHRRRLRRVQRHPARAVQERGLPVRLRPLPSGHTHRNTAS